MSPNRGIPRLFRGSMLAGCAAALGVAAHAAAGGGVPDTLPVAALTLGFGALGIGLAGRRRGVLTILPIIGLAQLGMHLVLSMSMAHTSGTSSAMLGAHALATLLTALLLAKAERTVFALAKALRRVLPRRIPTLRPLTVTVLVLVAPRAERRCGILRHDVIARRGPPLPAFR